MVAAAAVVAIMCCGPTAARARTLHTVFQDDTLSLFTPRELPRYMSTLHWLGVDELRVSAEWKLEAPAPNSPQAPTGFDARDPNSYHSAGMALLDQAVRAAARAGLNVIIDPAFSAPLWATTDRPRTAAGGHPAWYVTNINTSQLAAWETMLARRFSGTFTPAGERGPLPRAAAFTLWNEPNEPSFLEPQWRDGIAASADWYRQLVELAYPAIKRAAPGALVLIGNTSPSGQDAHVGDAGVPPLAFIRRLACVDDQLRPVSDDGCADFRPVPADGYAQHPYERDAPPWVPSGAGRSDWVQMGDLPKLQTLLDKLVATGRLAPGAANLWLTEQGYESNGQLGDRPWTEAQQAQLNADAEYVAWRDPHVMSFSQFLLRDTRTSATLALRKRTGNPKAQLSGTWTTGLERETGAPKPALWMFRAAIVARIAAPAPAVPEPGPSTLTVAAGLPAIPPAPPIALEVWGRARPVNSPALVQVQLRDPSTGAFRLVREARTDSNGIFDVRIPIAADRPVAVRFQWLAGNGAWQSSPATSPANIPVGS